MTDIPDDIAAILQSIAALRSEIQTLTAEVRALTAAHVRGRFIDDELRARIAALAPIPGDAPTSAELVREERDGKGRT